MRLFCLILLGLSLWAQSAFEIAGRRVEANTRLDFDLPVPALGDPGTRIPITVIHGAQPGPVLAITCGVHGFEYIPILAAQEALRQIDPKQLAGTLILVRLAHVPAFERRSVFFNPYDGKNLNRVFPGSPLGSQSQRIAHLLSTEVIGRATLHIDMHGGDGTESLASFAGAYSGKLAAAQAAQSREMALAFNLPLLVHYAVDTEEQLNTGRSCNRQAVAMGKPTVLIEIGEWGKRDPAQVDLAVRGILNVLRSQKMLPGVPLRNRRQPLEFQGTTSASTPQGGIWYPQVTTGTWVKKDTPLGVVRGYDGKELVRVTSPAEGMVLYMAAAPPVNDGQSVVTIALPRR